MAPRYEYRVWADDLGDLLAALHIHAVATGERESEETYLVRKMDTNIKIRAGVIDVKQLLETTREFQLWTPVLKEAFPLATATVHDVFRYLTDTDAGGTTNTGPCDRVCLIGLAEGAGAVAATVSKDRHGFVLESCILEFAQVTINGLEMQSVAVESEDLDTAISVATRLEIDALPNQSYPKAIRAALRL